jgi:hypothetical protein
VHTRGSVLQLGVERSSSCVEGSSALMMSQGSGAWMTSRGSAEGVGRSEGALGGLGACPLLGFEWSKAWAGCDGPWALIFVLVGSFVVKMGYPHFIGTRQYRRLRNSI